MHTLLDYNAAKEFAVYPKKYLSELMEEIEETKAEIASGKRPVFYTLDAMFVNIEVVREAERRLDDIYSGRSSTIPLIDIAKRYGVDC